MMQLDGEPVTAADMSSLALINYGHFTSMLVEQSQVRGLELHLDRLARDCAVVFGTDLDLVHVRNCARKAAAQMTTPAVMRITVFDPELALGHPADPAHPRVLVTVRPASSDRLPPIRLRSVPYVRDVPQVKHVGLFGTVHHRRAAQLAGYDDVLFTDHRGQIVEGATWNIGFIWDDGIVWPDGDCLPGVTMNLLNAAADKLGINTRTANLTCADLPDSGAGFITNAAIGIRPVAAIDYVELGPSPLIETLRRVYDAITPTAL